MSARWFDRRRTFCDAGASRLLEALRVQRERRISGAMHPNSAVSLEWYSDGSECAAGCDGGRGRPSITRCGFLIGSVAVVVLMAVAACGGATTRPGAAEPAVAPTSTQSPSGRTVAVGSSPEGIVYDPTTGLVAVAVRDPDRLILLDGATLAIVKSVPLSGHVRHLQLAAPGGPVLVPEEDANTLAVVSLPSGSVSEIKTGTSPHDATAVTGGYVVGDEFGRSITIARTGQALQTISGLMQPGGVVGFGDQVVVVDVGNFTVSTYRVSDGTRIAKVAAGKGQPMGCEPKTGSSSWSIPGVTSCCATPNQNSNKPAHSIAGHPIRTHGRSII